MARRPEFLVLAMDLGSSSVRTALFDHTAKLLAETTAHRNYTIRYSADGGAELSALTLRRAAAGCVAETLRLRQAVSGVDGVPIRAISGCSFWHSLLGLDRHGIPATPIFTWADSRSQSGAAQLRREFSEREVQLRTGCMLRAPYWPAKLRWLRRTHRSAWKRSVRWVSPVEWIFHELVGVESTSRSMASGTGLYDLENQTWDTELCAACGIGIDQLASIADYNSASAKAPRDLRGATVFHAIGDGAASNLGSGADRHDRVAINAGTSAAVRTVQSLQQAAAATLPFGLFRYAVDRERTLFGGAVSNGGNLRQWCLRELRLKDDRAAEKALARRSPGKDQLTVLPCWVNERAPSWPEGVHGVVAGLTQTTTAADVFQAVTRSAFYRLADILQEVERASRCKADQVIVSGGILHSPASLALLADCLGRDIHISRALESSLRGAAIFAIKQLGGAISGLTTGRLVRHEARCAEQHQLGRERQRELERHFAADVVSPTHARRRSRRDDKPEPD